MAPLRKPSSLAPELEAANQRLIASDREYRSSTRPRAVAAAHTAKEVEDAKRAAETLRQQVHHQSEIIDRLRETVGSRSGHDHDGEEAASTGVSEAVEAAEAAAEAAQDEADKLRDRLAETERELQRMERRSAMSGGRGTNLAASDGDTVLGKSTTSLMLSEGSDHEKEVRLERENRRLKEENDKLSTELQAFDLDFFEEIEDLKYKYSEAVRKLRQYED